MEFSWLAFFVTISVVCVEGVFAFRNKTFSRKQMRRPPVRLTFLWHWGVVVGDLVILPVFNGIVAPYVHLALWQCIVFSLTAPMITWSCHRAWWPTSEKSLNFMSPDWRRSLKQRGCWHADMSSAGWIHFMFMVGQLIMIMGYVFNPMPKELIQQVCIIFLVFIPFGVIEPGVVEGWPLSTGKKIATFGIAIALWSLVGAVTWLKL